MASAQFQTKISMVITPAQEGSTWTHFFVFSFLFLFLRLLFKWVFSLFFCNRLTISYASFGEKIHIGCAVFTLISINQNYCAMSPNFCWPPFLKRIIFFKFYSKNVNVFMFFYFKPNFIKKFHWKSSFSNFGHVTIFEKRKFVFWPPF